MGDKSSSAGMRNKINLEQKRDKSFLVEEQKKNKVGGNK